MYFDTHAHLDDQQFQQDQDEVIARAKNAGVELIVNIGYNLQMARHTMELTKKHDFIYGAVGMHPHDARDLTEDAVKELKTMVENNTKIVALGEMGLDYFRNHSPQDIQRQAFRRQIALAKELKLPIIIHDRDAHQDVVDIIKEEGARDVGGIFHCYSGHWPLAREIIGLGFYISLAGPVTFNNAKKAQEVARMVPLEHFLIETDCPYLAPMPFRGERNEPMHVINVAEMIAQIKRLPVETVARVTLENGKKVFGIK